MSHKEAVNIVQKVLRYAVVSVDDKEFDLCHTRKTARELKKQLGGLVENIHIIDLTDLNKVVR